MPNSGTRFNALQVLGAYDLGVKDLAEVREKGLEDAAGQLAAGRLDAFFVTIGAPYPGTPEACRPEEDPLVVAGQRPTSSAS